jgi:molybdenum cofactor synthesis domain-containing protein
MNAGRHHDRETGAPLVPFDQAQRRAIAGIDPLPPQDVPLRAAHGCVLPTDVTAPIDLPPFASSAMDGFAVRSEDVAGATAAGPVALRMAGRVVMGEGAGVSVDRGSAVSVPTGGQVPDGADAVAPVEHCVVEGDRVLILRPSEAGRHVRPAGEDVRAGEVLVPAGRRLTGADLGALAAAGLATVSVRPRARVGILSTGDELVEPGRDRAGARIFDANAFTLHGSVLDAGALPVALGTVPDDPRRLAEALAAASDADLLVSSGGVSVGERDPVRVAFAGRGEVEFLEVAMQPGKPQAFGRIGDRPYFGLPGNPVSVFVSFEMFVRPALMRMMGRRPARAEVTASLDGKLTGPPEKVRFARVRVRREGDRWRAAPTGGRQSNLLATVSRANGLAVVPLGVEALHPGDRCRVLLFRDPDEP